MKAPGGAPRKFSEAERKELIEKAQTIEELCDAIRKIGPISKGFLRGKTDVAEVIKSLKKASKENNTSLIHSDSVYYPEQGNFAKKIKLFNSSNEKNIQIQQPQTIKMRRMEELTELGIDFQVEENLRIQFPKELGGGEIKKYVGYSFPLAREYNSRASINYHTRENLSAAVADILTATGLLIDMYTSSEGGGVDKLRENGELQMELSSYFRSRSFYLCQIKDHHGGLRDMKTALKLYHENEHGKAEMEKEIERLTNIVKGNQSSAEIKTSKITYEERLYVINLVAGDLKKQHRFTNYQDYLHSALYLINKHWPAGKSKTNEEIQEVFEMVDKEMRNPPSLKQEKVILTEEKRKEVIRDIVSQIKVKYSYGEYSKKDVREYIEDVGKTLLEKLNKENIIYDGNLIIKLLLEIIEEWAVSSPLVATKDLNVSEQVAALKREVEKLHNTIKLQKTTTTEVVNVNTTKYVLVERFNLKFNLFGIEIDNNFNLSSVVEAVWKILKDTFGGK